MTKLDLLQFIPFRMNRLAAEISTALSSEYRDRYRLDVPEWRVIATLGFREGPCTAQFIVESTRTHKSTISRAVASLLARRLIERVGNAEDRREYSLQLSAEGLALYEELIPRLLQRETEILSCLSLAERDAFRSAMDKLERSLGLTARD